MSRQAHAVAGWNERADLFASLFGIGLTKYVKKNWRDEEMLTIATAVVLPVWYSDISSCG